MPGKYLSLGDTNFLLFLRSLGKLCTDMLLDCTLAPLPANTL